MHSSETFHHLVFRFEDVISNGQTRHKTPEKEVNPIKRRTPPQPGFINLGKTSTGREEWLQHDLSYIKKASARYIYTAVKRQQKAHAYVQAPHKNISPNPAGQGRLRRRHKPMR